MAALPLFCLLLISAVATTTTTAIPPQAPSSALLAAEILHARGYSHFAALIVSLSTVVGNFSGTLLAPPDFAFSATPPRPSVNLLLYHTLKPPLILTWPALTSLANAEELRTHFDNNCLYAFRNLYGGEISISASPNNNPPSAIQIRQPDLYADGILTVHGVDGVLDPSFATKCSPTPPSVYSADEAAPPRLVNRTFLEHAMKGLRRMGYHVPAAAMAVRKSQLLALTSVTVFAVSDKNLFLKPNGFRYDFRHHVVPTRLRFADLANLMDGTPFLTLAENKTVLVNSVDGAVTIDGVLVDAKEAYHNRWIVVLSIASSLDDVVSDFLPNSSIPFGLSDDLAPPPAGSSPIYPSVVLPPAPSPTSPTGLNSWTGSPEPAWELDWVISGTSPAPSPTIEESANSLAEMDENQCVVEGGDLFCPTMGSVARRLEEKKAASIDDKVRISENVNIADDVFFYI